MLNSPPAIMGVLHKQQDTLRQRHTYQCWNVVDAKNIKMEAHLKDSWGQKSKHIGGIENTIVKERNINKIVVFVQILYTGL